MKVFLNMVGCRLNQAEIENLALSLVEAGVEVVSDPAEADEIIINTCCVTAKASADSRKMLRHHKAINPSARVIGTGCWVSISQNGSTEQNQILDKAYTNSEKNQILADLLQKAEPFHSGYERIRPDLGARNRTRGFVKVQDGCDNRCAYCLTQVARGRSVSTEATRVVEYVQKLRNLGIKEIILTGVQLGSWGKDLEPRRTIADLVKFLLQETDIPRIRLSSIEPWDINPELISLYEDSRLCPHMHIPLQSGSDEILRKMSRPMDTERFRKTLGQIREISNDFAVTTDVICGFPGETEAMFRESLSFIEECQFSGGHVFQFSALEGTAAFGMGGQVQNSIRKERTSQVAQVLADAENVFISRRLGNRARVLFESRLTSQEESVWQGWSEDYLKVHLSSPEDLRNRIVDVELESINAKGEVIARLRERG